MSVTAAKKTFVGGVMVVLLLVLQLFAASPTLHHWLHADSSSPSHQCAITLLSHGHVDHAPVEIAFAAEAICSRTTFYSEPLFIGIHDQYVFSGRAPPSCFA